MVKNGVRDRKQQYKCKDCGRQFLGGIRRDKPQIISEYIEGKQTRKQLAAKYGVSVRTIERDLEGMRYVQKVSKDKSVVIQMDTTYWGRGFGMMVIKDAYRNKVLWRKYVRYETIAGYLEGVDWLKEHGFRIYGVVIDGLRGLAEALRIYPVQHCQFHQMMTVRHYLTGNPDIEASRELLSLSRGMTKMDKNSFIGAFDEWYVKYKDVLNERVHRQEDEDASLYEAEPQECISQHKKEHETPMDVLRLQRQGHTEYEQRTGGCVRRHQVKSKGSQRTYKGTPNQVY